jgi:hypothetical protein
METSGKRIIPGPLAAIERPMAHPNAGDNFQGIMPRVIRLIVKAVIAIKAI